MNKEIQVHPSELLAQSAVPFDAVLKLLPEIEPAELRERIKALLDESAALYDPACMYVLDIERSITRHLETLAVKACDSLDISLVQADEPEVKGEWNWIGSDGTASGGFTTDVEAAMDALRHHLSKASWS